MILSEIKDYLSGRSIEVELLDIAGDNGSCICYKGGPSEKSGSRRKNVKYHLNAFVQGNNFRETYNRANVLYKELHFPDECKLIELETHVIHKSTCLSRPEYTGTDDKERHLFAFDIMIYSFLKD